MVTHRSDSRKLVTLRVSYDRGVDVLHLATGKRADLEGEGRPDGIELDYAVDDGRPCAVTVFGYMRHGWIPRLRELAQIAGSHLSIDPLKIVRKIEKETGK